MFHAQFLEGKRALVTGSTSGIGLAIARALAGAGAQVVLNGFGDAGEIAGFCKELDATHSGADLTDAAQIEAMMAEAGEIDVLVNNAGMQHVAPEIHRNGNRRGVRPSRHDAGLWSWRSLIVGHRLHGRRG